MSPVVANPADLIAYLQAARPDWDYRQIEGAVSTVMTDAKWTYERTAQESVRLACDPAASPRDLTEAARDPLDRRRPSVPNDEYRRMREQMAARGSE